MPIDRTSHLVAQEPKGNGPRRSFYRIFAQFLCSNMGLIILVIAYSIGGAFLFILLEQYIELQSCQQANLLENVSISNISETMYNYVVIADDEDITIIYDEIVSYLQSFTNDIYDRRSTFRYTGQDCSTVTGWSFSSALLFTITIMTSIGYGHVTPTSWEGQITCICYALIGVPIFLLCLANISSILGDMFRFMYSSLLHCACCCCRIYARTHRRHIRPRRSIKRHGIQYVGTTSSDLSWSDASPNDFQDNPDHIDGDDDEIDDDINDVFDRMESRVPILAVISIIMGYVCLGAIMFKNTEGWTMTESVYFCYVTLSTMGFGDYVPGITSSGTNGLRFLGACLYIIIGLAILAMCFDLIKESIVDKFAWLARKLGVADGDDDDDDDNVPIRYSDFQYSTPRDVFNHQQMHTPLESRLSESPPAYDYKNDGEQWFKDIKDKVETSNVKKN